jgi:hypothetical protein
MPAETRSLHRKLAQVMYEVGRIPKNGTAPPAMGGYKFVEVGDAADAIRKALADKVITMMPTSLTVVGEVEHETKSGGTMTTMTVQMDWTITDGESGETIVLQSIGTGSDTGDKFASKATTSAMKYALLSGFLLSTGDDIERTDTSDRKPQQHPGLVDGDPKPPDRPPLERTTHENGLVGKAAASGNQDFQLRQTPDGLVLPFRVKEGNRAGQIVVAHGQLAENLAPFRDTIIGQTVTVWGRFTDEESPPKPDGFIVRYKVLHLERIATPDFILPAAITDSPVKPEAVPEPLFPPIDDDEAAEIREAEMAEAELNA